MSGQEIVMNTSLAKFRECIESIPNVKTRTRLQVMYLLAARDSELCLCASKWEFMNNHTKPYGVMLTWKFEPFVVNPKSKDPVTEKALVVQMAVAKRLHRITKGKIAKHEEAVADNTQELLRADQVEAALTKYKQIDLLNEWKEGKTEISPLVIQVLMGQVKFKSVALPVKYEYEPWIHPVTKYLTEHGTLSFNCTRRTLANEILELHERGLLPPLKKYPKGTSPSITHAHTTIRNPMRHFRLQHLLTLYGFSPEELASYSGWTLASTMAQSGHMVSSNIDFYAGINWRQYFPKLLHPLPLD